MPTPDQLQATLDNANLYISDCRTQLKSHRFDGLEDVPGGEDSHALSDPAIVASDVTAQAVRARPVHTHIVLMPPPSRSSANSSSNILSKKPRTNMSRRSCPTTRRSSPPRPMKNSGYATKKRSVRSRLSRRRSWSGTMISGRSRRSSRKVGRVAMRRSCGA